MIEPGGKDQLPDKLYFISKGGIQLEAMGQVADEKKILARVGPGECFPVEALYERRPVFSTFRAQFDTDYYVIGMEDYLSLEERSPLFRDYCQHRADGFLESSRKIYHSHYASKGSEQFTLDSPLSLLARPEPSAFSPDTPIRDVLSHMAEKGLRVVAVVNPASEPIGIFSIEDLLDLMAKSGLDTNSPVSLVMRKSTPILSPQNLGHEAALLMAMYGFDYLFVADNGRLTGILTERDLFSLQRVGLGEISNMIRRASSLEVLKKAAGDIRLLASNMLAQGVSAEQLTRIISTLNDHLSERVIQLEIERSGIEGIDFCWIALGSEGRLEQTFCTDQDNGIIFVSSMDKSDEEIRSTLLPVAQRINQSLAECGFPLCKGNIMAGNPQWCLSLDEWKKRFSAWIAEPVPEALLNSTIFFDFRPMSGYSPAAEELRSWLMNAAEKNRRFIHLMVDNALERGAPVGFFNNFVVDKNGDHPNTIDLKLSGIALFADAARIYALANGLPETGTADRLRAAAKKGKIEGDSAEAWIDGFYFIQMLRLRHQFELGRAGREMHNRINPYELNELDRRIFLESLKQAGKVQKSLSSSYGIKAM